MRRRHSKLRMGFRGRSGLLASVVCGTAVLALIYYTWGSYFGGTSKIRLSSVQGVGPSQLDHWGTGRQRGPVLEDPPIGLNREIEMQVANENWKKAKALQDRIDEERLAEEQAAQAHGKRIDDILKTKKENPDSGKKQAVEGEGRPLNPLFRQADPIDGDYFSKLERIVHLDLKGAPPLVSYLENLFPVLKKMGATGLLMEYEDMFPYSGNLSILTSASAYSVSDLQRIQAAAQHNDLEIIPLVQTFGHMEFVLKHKSFASLREHNFTPQVITPVREESYTLIFSMLEQVVKAHPLSRRIHLGCDEVYQLGEGQSNTYMTSQRLTPQRLFLQHVVKMARRLKSAFPAVRSLIWDDWLRKTPYADIASSGLPELVEPVVWYYRANILDRIPPDVWDTYSKLFSGVWVASAFKGATGSAQILTNASTHVENNLQWVSVIRTFGIQRKSIPFRGVVLTGWQRYDHFATLCELLPVGLPSLALSMQAVKSGAFGPKEMSEAQGVLGCSSPLDLEFPALEKGMASVSQDCSFPGRDIFYGIQQLWGILEVYRKDQGLQDRIAGWLTDYQVRQGISNPGQMKILVKKLYKVMLKLQELPAPMRRNMLQIYDKFTVEEWITTNLQDRVNHIKDLIFKAKKLLEPKVWPARPFVEPTGGSPGVKSQPGSGQNVQPGAVQKMQPGALQMGVQSGAQNVPGQGYNAAAPQGPQSVAGRVRVNGVRGQGGNSPQNNGRHAQQTMGMVQKQNAGVANAAMAQGGRLSETLLGKSDQGAQLQGRPSGPSKMQNVDQNGPRPYPQNRQGQQSMNFQVVPNQRQQNLGQYVAGLQQAQKQLQNTEGLRLNQYSQQNQGLAQAPPNQQVQKPNNVQGPLTAQGPPKLGAGQMLGVPAARDQRGEQAKGNERPALDTSQELNTGGKHDQLLHLPARGKGYSDKAVEDLRSSDRDNPQQKDAEFLDSFVGRGGRNKNNFHPVDDHEKADHGLDDRRKADNDYNAEEDEEEAAV